MKKLKSIMCIMIVLCFCISISSISAENKNLVMANEQLTDTSKNVCVDLKISTSNVVIERNGYGECVNAIAILTDNSERNVNDKANWETDNPGVAYAYNDGSIVGKGKGKARIKVSYGGFERYIDVEVLKEVNLLNEAKELNQKLNLRASRSLSAAERQEIIDRAMTMLSYTWTPTRNLAMRGTGYFYPGTYYLGIPYTQVDQVDRDGFIAAMSKSDFYTTQYYDGGQKHQPKYGNDCSGFVSFSWDIPRIDTGTFFSRINSDTYPKVGSYTSTTPTSPTTAQLLASYPLMQTGDAIVYRNSSNTAGHIRIISANFTNESRVQCFENRGPTCEITFWTYNQLASMKYMPFSKN